MRTYPTSNGEGNGKTLPEEDGTLIAEIKSGSVTVEVRHAPVAASELLEQVEDRAWLAKVTNALNQHWQKRNAAKKNWLTGESPKEQPASTSAAMTGD